MPLPEGILPPSDKKLKPIPKLSARKENGAKPNPNSIGNDSKSQAQTNVKNGGSINGRRSPSNGHRPKSPVNIDKPQAINPASVRPKSAFLQNLQNEKKNAFSSPKTFDSNGRKTPPISESSKLPDTGPDSEKTTSSDSNLATDEKYNSKSAKNKGKVKIELGRYLYSYSFQ